MDKRGLAAKAKEIIKNNIYMTIATASRKGKPWISPLYFAYDSKLNFYWSSTKSSLHSRLISKNNNVAAVIFDSRATEGTGDGVYMVGKAFEVRGAEIQRALHILSYRTGKVSEYFKGQTPEDYVGKSPVRFYKFVPSKFWILGDPVKIKGRLVDIRREIHLKKP